MVETEIQPILDSNPVDKPLSKAEMLRIFAVFAREGLTAPRLPPEFGGSGMNMLDYGMVYEQLPPVVAISLLSFAGFARAEIMVKIDKSSQRMSVIVNGEHRYTWPVSTGIYGTPSGTFRPQSLSRDHHSSLYHNAPMPYSIFYDGNFAIHGTPHTSQLGGPASRGCIRLHPSNAAILFSLVQKEGLGNTRVSIQ